MNAYQEIHDFARELAPEIGDGWRYDVERSSDTDGPRMVAYITGPEFTIYICRDAGKGGARVEYPRDSDGSTRNWLPYGTQSPTCSWTWGRPAKAVAGHIRRSVLAPMADLWPFVAQRIEGDRSYTAALADSRARAAAALGLSAWPVANYGRERETIGSTYGARPIEICPYGNEWEIKIRLPVDRAEALVAGLVRSLTVEPLPKE